MPIKLTIKSKYLFYLIMTIILVSFYFLGIFLYENFYLAIAQSSQIYLSSSELALQRVDLNRLVEVVTKIDKKTAPTQIDWTKVKNPFRPYQ